MSADLVASVELPTSGHRKVEKQPSVLSEAQQRFTEERVCGLSKHMIEHMFEELDADGSGAIDLEELPLLAKQVRPALLRLVASRLG